MVPMVSARGTAGSSYADHIVGRAEQRDQLRRVLDDVIDDGSRFVIVGGDAGAGKTTVIEAFVADLGCAGRPQAAVSPRRVRTAGR